MRSTNSADAASVSGRGRSIMIALPISEGSRPAADDPAATPLGDGLPSDPLAEVGMERGGVEELTADRLGCCQ